MLAGGQAGETVQFKYLQSPAFYRYGMVWLSCQKLQVQQLPTQVMARMEEIAAIQVHWIDVERIFIAFTGPHKHKEMVCESIERCKALRAYNGLMRMPEYDEFTNCTNAVLRRLEKECYATLGGRGGTRGTAREGSHG